MRKKCGLDFPDEICPAKCQCRPLPKTERITEMGFPSCEIQQISMEHTLCIRYCPGPGVTEVKKAWAVLWRSPQPTKEITL